MSESADAWSNTALLQSREAVSCTVHFKPNVESIQPWSQSAEKDFHLSCVDISEKLNEHTCPLRC